MNEKDFNQVIMTFFQDDSVRAFSMIYGEFKKIDRTIELQRILNTLLKEKLIEKTQSGNYKRTKKMESLLDETGLSYGGQPWSYYLSIKKDRKPFYERITFWLLVIGTIATVLALLK